MKWMGLGITSAVMGMFLAAIAETAYPALSPEGFIAAAVAGGAMIFAIMIHLTLSAGHIDVRPPGEWEAPKAQ
jgi:hypothetical protein